MMGMKRARLSAVALGVAMGVLSAAWMFGVGLSAWKGVFGVDIVNHWATFYPGVAISLQGALIAGAWGFLKGFFYGLILSWIYNLCLCCCTRCCPCCKCGCGQCGTAGQPVDTNKP